MITSPPDYRFTYLRTKDDVEVDLLIEIKSSTQPTEHDFRTLATMAAELSAEAICLCRGNQRRLVGSVEVWPWQEGLLHYFGPQLPI